MRTYHKGAIENELAWRKSTFSESGNCVEVAEQADGGMLVRNSKDQHKQTLHFTTSQWIAFVKGVKNNEFDVD